MRFWNMQAYWWKVIEKELEKLEAGDARALLTSYCAFASGNKKLIQKAGSIIRQQLENQTLGQMIRLYERFRTFTSLEWSIDWAALSLQSVLSVLGREDQKYMLILGTFHPNGYFREKCMEEAAKMKGTLPYLLLRTNDWAEPVRKKAFLLSDPYIRQCSIEEILAAVPVFEKLQYSGRRSDEQWEELKKSISDRLEQTLKNGNLQSVWPKDFSIRKSLYRFAIELGILHIEEMDEWLRKEKDSYGRIILIRGILTHPDCTISRASVYLTYPNIQIRRYALEYRYEAQKESWPELPDMLLDPGRSIRQYAAYILERHTNLDIREYYLRHLKDESPEYAILGLAEYSQRGNVAALLPGLGHPIRKVRKNTILALGYQEDFEDEGLLWKYLLDGQEDISKASYISIQKKGFYPGGEKLYQAYCTAEKEHNKRYLLRLLLRENSWNRLPWLLRIYDENLSRQERWLVKGGINCRFMYAKVEEEQKKAIYQALEEKKEKLPQGMAEEILYDLKFM